jgi:hypothetical protein
MAQLLLALTGIAVSFLVVSGLQALVLSAAAWRDPQRSAYQAAKAQVMPPNTQHKHGRQWAGSHLCFF